MEGEMQDVRDRVLSLIQPNEVVALALALGNIASPAGHEGEIGRYLFDWLRRNEFSPRTVGFVPERSCVFGVLPGIIGMVQAIETIKLIIGIGQPLVGRLLSFDALKMKFSRGMEWR